MSRSMIVTAVVVALGALAPSLAAQFDRTNQIEAVVNDKVVTRYDVLKDFDAKGINLDDIPLSEAKKEFEARLEVLVLEILKGEASEKAGISLRPEDIQNSLNRLIEVRGGEEGFRQFLQDRGLSEKEYIEDFRRQQEAGAWLRVLAGSGGGVKSLGRNLRPLFDITVTPNELRSFYKSRKDSDFTFKDRSKVRVIQRYFRGSSAANKRSIRSSISTDRLKVTETGADFGVIAARTSEHSSAEKQGDIGWIEADNSDLPSAIVEEIFKPENRKAGTVIGPIENVSSFWLVEVTEIENARVRSFEDALPDLKAEVQRIKYNRAIAGVLLDVVDKSHITPAKLKRSLSAKLAQSVR
ncbi:MAG: peptidyl-prolyl cis-trans isomerase [Planctomycetota bacterium]